MAESLSGVGDAFFRFGNRVVNINAQLRGFGGRRRAVQRKERIARRDRSARFHQLEVSASDAHAVEVQLEQGGSLQSHLHVQAGVEVPALGVQIGEVQARIEGWQDSDRYRDAQRGWVFRRQFVAVQRGPVPKQFHSDREIRRVVRQIRAGCRRTFHITTAGIKNELLTTPRSAQDTKKKCPRGVVSSRFSRRYRPSLSNLI